ncbi:MAG: hypothetical protein J2P48_21595 [Alphaproteobacteria bacterium]|nr:hypothetical protein [Alphaproteobacteria bacterium]
MAAANKVVEEAECGEQDTERIHADRAAEVLPDRVGLWRRGEMSIQLSAIRA